MVSAPRQQKAIRCTHGHLAYLSLERITRGQALWCSTLVLPSAPRSVCFQVSLLEKKYLRLHLIHRIPLLLTFVTSSGAKLLTPVQLPVNACWKFNQLVPHVFLHFNSWFLSFTDVAICVVHRYQFSFRF